MQTPESSAATTPFKCACGAEVTSARCGICGSGPPSAAAPPDRYESDKVIWEFGPEESEAVRPGAPDARPVPPGQSTSAASTLSDRDVILAHVSEERDRQDAKWGGVPGVERRDDHTYAAVLGEEFGEVCQAWLQRDVAALREELVQTAAVAVAWVEEIDNGGGLARAE